ncbi:uncharacterized protein LOC115221105 [Octopus sinensis]|uniref:Uncharacterized protein LOC115221105 n=1 Tax=Octopus sinensis TaxID=2607531 RepID=A0A6P7T8P2_9MOLL|nr:uncharacterized protein LOC115221105 [Octopus sinensis]
MESDGSDRLYEDIYYKYEILERESIISRPDRNHSVCSKLDFNKSINMQKIIITLLVVGIMFAMQVSCQESMLAPPNRPSEFRSPEELRKYLKALNEYYAIVGRPRFGRSVSKRAASNTFAEALTSKRNDE